MYKGLKPVYWCPDCNTALAEAEIEYSNDPCRSIYVKFNVTDDKGIFTGMGLDLSKVFFVIWTTTTWTIPGNLAVCLGPEYNYTLVKNGDEYYVMAEELVKTTMETAGITEYTTEGIFTGAELEGMKTKHPLYDRLSPIIVGDHVTLESGTGCVHTAPGYGVEDFEVCKNYDDIGILVCVDAKGRQTAEAGEFEGMDTDTANKAIAEKLEECGALLAMQKIVHQYPHCWRCNSPIIYRATEQWFCSVNGFKDEAVKAIENVKWIPEWGGDRIKGMVRDRSDWCISRQRTWGVPIPIIYCKDCGKPIVTDDTIKAISDLFRKEGADAWWTRELSEFIPDSVKCECGCGEFTKEYDIMDVWFDSGVTWRAVVEKRAEELGHTPVDMYLEGSDQHRGWFQSSLLTSMATQGKVPYKSVLTHGFVFGEDGRKMSKSLGNYIRPDDIIKNYGADILRLWAASVDYRNDTKIGDNIIKQLSEIFKKTRNTARFLLGNIFDFDPSTDYVKYEDLKPIDKFALHKLNKVVEEVTTAFNNYEFYKYFQCLQNFAAVDLSAFYLDIVKDRLYTAGKKSLSRRACQTVLYETLQVLARILSPVMPHQAEDIWQNTPECQRGGLISILLADWVNIKPEWNNEKLDEEFSKLLKLREIVTKAIEPLRSSEDKIIGSSLEADVLIQCGKDAFIDENMLKKYESDLKDLFIVSHAYIGEKADFKGINEHKEDNITVSVQKANGEKCSRCWKYRELNTDGICEDCKKAIEE